MISIRDVQFAYRPGVNVLDVPHVDVGSGLTLLLGANGAGKTTLMRIVAGVERPDAGTVSIDGWNLWTDEVKARRCLAYVPDHADLTPFATVSETLTLVARLRDQPSASVAFALRTVGLESLGHRTVRELSHGQRRRAVLAAAMIGEPRALLLDEPLEALDDPMRDSLLGWVGEALARAATVLVSTHDVSPFEKLATGTLRLRDGRIVP
jgi:ABC-type multidrug transport system ATPase subunit